VSLSKALLMSKLKGLRGGERPPQSIILKAEADCRDLMRADAAAMAVTTAAALVEDGFLSIVGFKF
jgi:hypothetical protein